jgi:hypothetical protein
MTISKKHQIWRIGTDFDQRFGAGTRRDDGVATRREHGLDNFDVLWRIVDDEYLRLSIHP